MPQASPMQWMILSITLSSLITTSFSLTNKKNTSNQLKKNNNILSKNCSWKW